MTYFKIHSLTTSDHSIFCQSDVNHLPSGINHSHLPSRWKYVNWRIDRDLICPGSTRYGHRHRSKKTRTHPPEPRTSLPIPILGHEIVNEALNRPSLSREVPKYINSPMWIWPRFLIILIAMLCVSKITIIHQNKCSRHQGHDKQDQHPNNNITSPIKPKPLPSESIWIHLFSPPTKWSMISTIDSCGLRPFSCITKWLKRGIGPMYMADPSEPSSAEIPEWRIAQLAKRREVNKRYYDKKRVNNIRVPGAIRSRKCRQRKNQIQPIPERPTLNDR